MKTILGSLTVLAAAALIAAPAQATSRGQTPAHTPYATLPNGLPAGVVHDPTASTAGRVADAQDADAFLPYATLPSGLPAGIVRDPSATPAAVPVVRVVEPGGFQWTDALLGAAIAAGVIAAVALAALYSTRHRHRGPLHA